MRVGARREHGPERRREGDADGERRDSEAEPDAGAGRDSGCGRITPPRPPGPSPPSAGRGAPGRRRPPRARPRSAPRRARRAGRQCEQLVEVFGHEQEAAPRCRRASSSPCTYSVAPTSRPRVGWETTITLRVPRQHPRQEQLLDVAARERRARSSGAALIAKRAMSACAFSARSPSSSTGRAGTPSRCSSTRFLATRKLAAPGWRAGPRGSDPRPRRSPRSGVAPASHAVAHEYRPAVGRRIPQRTSTSSVWPLPETPATPERSRRGRTPSETSRSAGSPSATGRREPLDSQDRPVARSAVGDRRRRTPNVGRPTIMRRELALVRGAGDGAHEATAAQHADLVADRAYLVQLVADEDDREALARRAGAASRTAPPPPAARARRWARRG